MPAVGKGSRRGLRARLPEAQQGPAGQPHRRAFDFDLIAPRAPQNSFDAFISEVEFGKLPHFFFRRRSESADVE